MDHKVQKLKLWLKIGIVVAVIALIAIWVYFADTDKVEMVKQSDVTASKSANGINTKTDYYNFLKLLTQNETFSKKLSTKLTECDADQNAFYGENHEAYFDARGLKANSKDLTYLYMLDVLEENNYAFELDWKADVESLNYAIEMMSKGKLKDIIPVEEEEKAESMYDLLDVAEGILSKHNHALLMISIDGDSYPVALVPSDKLEELNKMMNKLF